MSVKILEQSDSQFYYKMQNIKATPNMNLVVSFFIPN